jgi:hypothetical protein
MRKFMLDMRTTQTGDADVTKNLYVQWRKAAHKCNKYARSKTKHVQNLGDYEYEGPSFTNELYKVLFEDIPEASIGYYENKYWEELETKDGEYRTKFHDSVKLRIKKGAVQRNTIWGSIYFRQHVVAVKKCPETLMIYNTAGEDFVPKDVLAFYKKSVWGPLALKIWERYDARCRPSYRWGAPRMKIKFVHLEIQGMNDCVPCVNMLPAEFADATAARTEKQKDKWYEDAVGRVLSDTDSK